jgi:hypothetical protein
MTEEIPLERQLYRALQKTYRQKVTIDTSEKLIRTLQHKLNQYRGSEGLTVVETAAKLRMLRAQNELKQMEILRLNEALETLNGLVSQIVEDNRRMKKVTEHFGHKKTRK